MSGKRDSNPRPSVWETDALPTELFPLIGRANVEKFFVISNGERNLLRITYRLKKISLSVQNEI